MVSHIVAAICIFLLYEKLILFIFAYLDNYSWYSNKIFLETSGFSDFSDIPAD